MARTTKYQEPASFVGVKQNRLTCIGVGETIFRRGKRYEYLKTECDCGNKRVVEKNVFKGMRVKSCGCLQRDAIKATNSRECHGSFNITHGMNKTKIHTVWKNMKSRCDDVKQPCYKNYGGRGIGYCPRWAAFENFYEDMGDVPDGHTLERVDVNKDYNKENCVWHTKSHQCYNQRKMEGTSAKYRGVSLTKSGNLYKGAINIEGKYIHLGYSEDPELLACRYDSVAQYSRDVESGTNRYLGLTSKDIDVDYPEDDFLKKNLEGYSEWHRSQKSVESFKNVKGYK